MAGAGAGDVWKIMGEDRAKHDSQFFLLKPINGFITGEQAKGFFMQSGLNNQTLGLIWSLADINGDGKMDKKEFSIAMHLIKKKLQGYELPKALPPSLRADPSPVVGAFRAPTMAMSAPSAMSMGMPPMGMGPMGVVRPAGAPTMTTGSMGMPIMANGMQHLGMQQAFPQPPVGGMPVAGMPVAGMPAPGMPVQGIPGQMPASGAGVSGWAMPHPSKLKYTQLFNTNDRKKCGFLSGVEARAILVSSGLPQHILAQIWNLADVDKDGKLTCDEFCLAMHLSDLARSGKVLPAVLPPELMPARGRSGSLNMAPPGVPGSTDSGIPKKDAFGDLLGTIGMPPPQAPSMPAANGEAKAEEFKEPESFEDRRKKNFDAGQAVLDQKRAQLQEQLRKMEQDRMEKERQEQEKRDRQRQEQERKRQMELERKMEKQRQLEMEREEQRKKQMEAREAAKRELERQRQMEWEQQRKALLLAEKHREYEQLSTLKAQFGNLKCELDSLDEKKIELNSKIQQVRNGVTDFTSNIEKMRETRDARLSEISRFEQELQEVSANFGRLHSDREQLTIQVQTSVQNTPLSDTHRTVMHSVELKKTNLQRLKKELEQLEKDTESNLSQIDIDNAELERLKKQVAVLQEELPRLQAKQHQRQAERQSQTHRREEEERLKAKLEAKTKRVDVQLGSAFSNGKGSADGWDAFGSMAPTGGGEAWGGGGQSGGDAWGGSALAQTGTGDVWGSDPFAGQTAAHRAGTVGPGGKRKYRAVFDFEARSEDELTVTTGDVIEVYEGETMPGMENWVKADFSGRVGWVPSNYVEPTGETALPATPTSASTTSPVASAFSAFRSEPTAPVMIEAKPEMVAVVENAESTLAFQSEPTAPVMVEGEPEMVAVVENVESTLAFHSEATAPVMVEGEPEMAAVVENAESTLAFHSEPTAPVMVEGEPEMVAVVENVESTLAFQSEPTAPVMVEARPEVAAVVENAEPSVDESALPSTMSPTPGEGQLAPEGMRAQALHPWKARQDNHLTFGKDDVITVRQQKDQWWLGDLGGKTGWFPKAYVKVTASGNSQSVSASASPAIVLEPETQSSASVSPVPDRKDGEYYVAMYAFTADAETDLSFNEGDMILVTDKSGDWWMGVLGDKTGTFPANYVKKVEMQQPDSSSELPGKESARPLHNALAGSIPCSSSGDGGGAQMPLRASGSSNFFSGDPFADLFPPSFKESSDPKLSGTLAGVFGTVGSKPVVSAVGLGRAEGKDSSKGSSCTGQSEQKPRPSGKEEGGGDLFSFDASWGPAAAPGNKDAPLFGVSPGERTEGGSGVGDDLFPAGVPLNKDALPPGVSLAEAGGGSRETYDDFFPSAGPPIKDAFPPGVDPSKGEGSSSEIYDDFFPQSSIAPETPSMLSGEESGIFSDVVLSSQVDTTRSLLSLGLAGSAASEESSSSTFPGRKLSQGLRGNVNVVETPKLTGDRSSSSSEVLPPLPPGRDRMPALNPDLAPNPPPRHESLAGVATRGQDDEPGAKSIKKPEIAVVIAPYTATGAGQLSLEQGNMILVRQKSPRGWWEGELQARGQKRKIGWFPANYVKLLGSTSARSTPDPHATLSTPPTSQLTASSAAGSRSATPLSQCSQSSQPRPATPASDSVQRVKALYSYEKQNDDELSFTKDDVITVLSQDNPDWWQGELQGQTGVFPSNYVVPLADGSLTGDGQYDSLQRNLPPKEKHRQNYIRELINTEETYMTDMSVVKEVFISPMKKAGVITEEEVVQIFVNWNDLIICNMKLLKALRVRKKMCGKGKAILMIGDILCENLPHMTPYVRFCSCQLSAAALLQRKSENCPDFQEFHKKCMRDYRTKGMPLSSFLLKPMQRITKYPLMIKEILKYTPEEHPDYGNLTDALMRAEEVCSEVNEGVRQKENSDRLEWIQKHVHTDGFPEKITFNSGTNCLGRRKVLHSGVLYKAKSNKELMAYLFNDFLLLTQPSRPLGRDVSALFNYDPEINMMFKMYKTPIVLNDVTVKKLSGGDADPCQFQVTYIDHVFNLKAITETERDVWVKKVDEAAKHFTITEKKKRERAQSIKPHKPLGRLLVLIVEGVDLRPTHSGDVRRTPGVGRLLVVIQEGIDLKACDDNGKSDPYCEVSMGSQEHRTKVLQGTLNPKWNASMQFTVKDVNQDVLCITVYDRDVFSPNDFLGRTEVRVKEVMEQTKHQRGPVTKCLPLHEVDRGKVSVKLDLQLFEQG